MANATVVESSLSNGIISPSKTDKKKSVDFKDIENPLFSFVEFLKQVHIPTQKKEGIFGEAADAGDNEEIHIKGDIEKKKAIRPAENPLLHKNLKISSGAKKGNSEDISVVDGNNSFFAKGKYEIKAKSSKKESPADVEKAFLSFYRWQQSTQIVNEGKIGQITTPKTDELGKTTKKDSEKQRVRDYVSGKYFDLSTNSNMRKTLENYDVPANSDMKKILDNAKNKVVFPLTGKGKEELSKADENLNFSHGLSTQEKPYAFKKNSGANAVFEDISSNKLDKKKKAEAHIDGKKTPTISSKIDWEDEISISNSNNLHHIEISDYGKRLTVPDNQATESRDESKIFNLLNTDKSMKKEGIGDSKSEYFDDEQMIEENINNSKVDLFVKDDEKKDQNNGSKSKNTPFSIFASGEKNSNENKALFRGQITDFRSIDPQNNSLSKANHRAFEDIVEDGPNDYPQKNELIGSLDIQGKFTGKNQVESQKQEPMHRPFGDKAMTQWNEITSRAILKGEAFGQLQLDIEPENLGKVTVKLQFTKNSLEAKFEVISKESAEILRSSLENLKESINNLGYELKDAQIVIPQHFEEQKGKSNKDSENKRKKSPTISMEGDIFREFLFEELNGESINIKA